MQNEFVQAGFLSNPLPCEHMCPTGLCEKKLHGHLYSNKISFPSCFRIRSYSNFFLLEILGPQMSILWDVRGGGVDQLIEQWDLFADKMNTKVQRLCFFTAVNSSGELLYCYDRSWHLISYRVIWDWSSVPFKPLKTGRDTRSWNCLKLCIMSKIFQGEGAKNVFLAYNVYLASNPSTPDRPPLKYDRLYKNGPFQWIVPGR